MEERAAHFQIDPTQRFLEDPKKEKKNYKEISNGHLNMKHHAPRAIYKTDN